MDGTTTEAEVLFEHPNAPRLVVRSPRNSTLQSWPLEMIHKVGKKEFHARRAATEEEITAIKINGLWGDEAGPKLIGKYATENWEQKPVMVWAHPGESGNAFEGANWLDEKGQPYADNPWKVQEGKSDQETGSFDGDILLPGANESYEVIQPGNRDHLGAFELRHFTAEEGAIYQVHYTIRGNTWLKQGARLSSSTQTGGLGSGDGNKHTFLRVPGVVEPPKGLPEGHPAWPHAPSISHWIFLDAGETGSLEVIGLCGGASDRSTIARGTVVISEDSYLGNGPRGAMFIREGATVILLDGAKLGCPDRKKGGSGGKSIGTYGIAGTLQFGTPEHPITRDLPFGMCVYEEKDVTPNAAASDRTSGASLVLASTGKMIVHSANPAEDRVLFQPRGKDMPVGQYMVPNEAKKFLRRIKEHTFSPDPEIWDVEGISRGVSAVFLGETDFNGVHFDGFYQGGIIVDPAARARWQNVTFGENNLAQSEELFQTPSGGENLRNQFLR